MNENFISDGQEFVFDSFINFKPVKRFENRVRCVRI